jgi:Xaa-Pro aminopeptidase
LHGALGDLLGDVAAGRVAFEAREVTVAGLAELRASTAAVDWVPTEDLVEGRRLCKDDGEVARVRAAQAITEAALLEVVGTIAVGMTEVEIAAELEHACRRRGASGMAFDTIVASGPRSALPHGVASGRAVAAGEPVLVDAGCRHEGYCSDLTRVVWLGADPDPGWLEVCGAVRSALEAALATVAAGVPARAVDAAARSELARHRLAEAFAHGTGHGVGLEIHEGPRVSRISDDVLVDGMVITIEPGVYLDGRYGVRIEDLVRVTDAGYRSITAIDHEPLRALIA